MDLTCLLLQSAQDLTAEVNYKRAVVAHEDKQSSLLAFRLLQGH